MATEEIIRLIVSFLGGGLVAGILNGIRINRSERIARKIQGLESQLRLLYGPLYFFTSQNEQHFIMNKEILQAYNREYSNKNWSQDKDTQKNLKHETTTTIEVANRYIALVKQNNSKIESILNENYYLIDPDDIEFFRLFMVDHTRLNIEVDDQVNSPIPFHIYKELGEISFMQPAFIERVKKKFHDKKTKLQSLNRK